jgi:aminoglycoside phosphotransferase (APT) family kinase protein
MAGRRRDQAHPPAAGHWRVAGRPGAADAIVHRDVAPWNLLERDGDIVGLVDWDLAGPGRAVADFAYLAWHLVPLHDEPTGDGSLPPPLAARPARLRLLADSYRLQLPGRQRFAAEVAAMQVRQAAQVATTPWRATPPRRGFGTVGASPRPRPGPCSGWLSTAIPSTRRCG